MLSKSNAQQHCILKCSQGNKQHTFQKPDVHECDPSSLKDLRDCYLQLKSLNQCSMKLTTGPSLCCVLLMLTSMRKVVTSKAIRPGTMSGGIKNPINDATVNMPVGRKMFIIKGV